MATTADFRNGMCIEYNGALYFIVQFQHVKPGKGPAFVRTKLKNVTTGKVIENTFNSGVKINEQRVERRPHQFIYNDESGYHFMNLETFEQITVDKDSVDNPDLLKEGQEVEVVYHADTETPMLVNLPSFINFEITYTEPGVRGDTSSTNSLKAATVETGATIMVPLFVNQGDKIKVDTRDRSYVERVK
jgi:elongation factor P